MRKNYNPWLLPPCLRKIRFYCKMIIIPITVFQLIRTLFVPTTGDFLLLAVLIGLCVAFYKDFI
ncbi:hypothetical protein C772_02862 [Bhargavaea cecembensis DSE10]|uniref:Uncharacterized protein n=1 Tax=Bhargavaea cecembensis DSE10 TaxID=1235279 RepID=M7NU37_9BACL|nr:hypothetical protein [Bhargavaea cecembensis]EMR05190.1 hypothetical protein C772_02862 [Bhargavaea cecembensis DSE10]